MKRIKKPFNGGKVVRSTISNHKISYHAISYRIISYQYSIVSSGPQVSRTIFFHGCRSWMYATNRGSALCQHYKKASILQRAGMRGNTSTAVDNAR